MYILEDFLGGGGKGWGKGKRGIGGNGSISHLSLLFFKTKTFTIYPLYILYFSYLFPISPPLPPPQRKVRTNPSTPAYFLPQFRFFPLRCLPKVRYRPRKYGNMDGIVSSFWTRRGGGLGRENSAGKKAVGRMKKGGEDRYSLRDFPIRKRNPSHSKMEKKENRRCENRSNETGYEKTRIFRSDKEICWGNGKWKIGGEGGKGGLLWRE